MSYILYPQPWNILRILCRFSRCFRQEPPPSSPSIHFPPPTPFNVSSFSLYLLLFRPSISLSTLAGQTSFVCHTPWACSSIFAVVLTNFTLKPSQCQRAVRGLRLGFIVEVATKFIYFTGTMHIKYISKNAPELAKRQTFICRLYWCKNNKI